MEGLGFKKRKSAPDGADKDREVYWSGRAQAIRTTTEVPVLLGKTHAWLKNSRLLCARSERLTDGVVVTRVFDPAKFGA
jgi:hypothetical protein